MGDTPNTTLEILVHQQAKMLAEMADQRVDMAALLTIIERLNATVGSLLNEVHALQARLEHHGHLPFDAFDKSANQP
jgi:hypothetical protein